MGLQLQAMQTFIVALLFFFFVWDVQKICCVFVTRNLTGEKNVSLFKRTNLRMGWFHWLATIETTACCFVSVFYDFKISLKSTSCATVKYQQQWLTSFAHFTWRAVAAKNGNLSQTTINSNWFIVCVCNAHAHYISIYLWLLFLHFACGRLAHSLKWIPGWN